MDAGRTRGDRDCGGVAGVGLCVPERLSDAGDRLVMHAIPGDLAFFLSLGGLGLVFLLVLYKISVGESTQNVLGGRSDDDDW